MCVFVGCDGLGLLTLSCPYGAFLFTLGNHGSCLYTASFESLALRIPAVTSGSAFTPGANPAFILKFETAFRRITLVRDVNKISA